eukprot:1137066-Pelagomonas_calceolata.AAC.11
MSIVYPTLSCSKGADHRCNSSADSAGVKLKLMSTALSKSSDMGGTTTVGPWSLHKNKQLQLLSRAASWVSKTSFLASERHHTGALPVSCKEVPEIRVHDYVRELCCYYAEGNLEIYFNNLRFHSKLRARPV